MATISSLKELWSHLATGIAQGYESSMESCEQSTARHVNWMVENRGGLARVTGFLLLPSQFYPMNPQRCMERLCGASDPRLQKVSRFVCGQGEAALQGVLCIPKGWNKLEDNRCVIYCNPNGIITDEYFEEGHLSYTPGKLLDLYRCPVYLFDYRGTGVNKEIQVTSSVSFAPTYESVVQDGRTVLETAFRFFERVEMWGSSLGGGVATVAVDRYINDDREKASRVRLFNHDSFSTTPRVVIPSSKWVANLLGWCVGGLIDAESAMRRLIARKISVTILCEDRDPVIPVGARMAEVIAPGDCVKIIHTQTRGHANLSDDAFRVLQLG